MKTKVICAALLAFFAIGINAQANNLTTLKAGKKVAVVRTHKVVSKKKADKPVKPVKKATTAKGKRTTAKAKQAK